MSRSLQFGIIDDHCTYTTKALARLVLEKQECVTEKGVVTRLRTVDTETIHTQLRALKCPAARVGRTVYVSGLHLRLAVEANASLDW